MNTTTHIALVGALLQGALGVLFAIVAHSTRERWATLMLLGCACGALVFGVLAANAPTLDMKAPPSNAMTGLIGLSYWLLTAALMSYLGSSRRTMVWVLSLMLVLLVGMRIGISMGWVQRAHGAAAGSLVVAAWLALAVRAARRDPQAGHHIVAVALLSFPLLWLSLRFAQVDPSVAVAWHVLPMSVVGMTLLTTGLLRAWRNAGHEVAQRRAAERQFRLANETLEQRVQQRTAQLSETIEGLESFNRSVSHDLRGPLGGMAELARMAAQRVRGADPASAGRMLDLIANQAKASEQLVASLLALARAGTATVNLQRVDTGDLVDEVLRSLRPAEASALSIRTQPLPPVDADQQLLRQVFVNLLGNAMKFTAHTEAPRIEVGAIGSDREPVFFVRDNGVGFDAAQSPRLFEPFHRLHGGSFEGTGIGLSIVKRIVESHGGRVWAESTPGQGAAFYFSVQAARSAGTQPKP